MIVVDKPKYKMAIYEEKKQVHVQIIGFIKPNIVEEYVQDLQETVAKVPKSNYVLVVDATYQSPLPYTVARDLGQTMMVYTTFGFKEVFIVNPQSKISYVQVRNGLETVDFPGIVVDHVSDLPIG